MADITKIPDKKLDGRRKAQCFYLNSQYKDATFLILPYQLFFLGPGISGQFYPHHRTFL